MSETERCVLLDFKHGTAVFFGSGSEMDERRKSLLDKCKDFGVEKDAETVLRVARESEFTKDEFDHMLVKRRIPRRVEMRLNAKVLACSSGT